MSLPNINFLHFTVADIIAQTKFERVRSLQPNHHAHVFPARYRKWRQYPHSFKRIWGKKGPPPMGQLCDTYVTQSSPIPANIHNILCFNYTTAGIFGFNRLHKKGVWILFYLMKPPTTFNYGFATAENQNWQGKPQDGVSVYIFCCGKVQLFYRMRCYVMEWEGYKTEWKCPLGFLNKIIEII